VLEYQSLLRLGLRHGRGERSRLPALATPRRAWHGLDFRVGGREHLTGDPAGGPVYTFDALYQNIVPNERIIYTYDMHLDQKRISVSLATVELKVQGTGTRLIFTEQAVYLDGAGTPADREGGTRALLDNLDAELLRQR
jgi:uncharacterized protein YndB with AHSA1/START domain